MATKVIVSKEKLDNLANAINTKAETSGAKTIDELILEVDNFQSGIKPSGTISITNNGIYNVKEYENANVNVVGNTDFDYIKYWASGSTLLDNPIDLYSESVLEVGSYAFNESPNIRNVNFPNCVKVAETGFKASSIESIDLQSVTSISTSAFYNCKKLKRVNAPSIEVLNANTFQGCSLLEEINVESLVELKNYVFSGCDALINLTFPKLNKFSNYVFSNCDNLKTVRFEDFTSTTRFGNYTFNNCINLTDVYVNYEGVVPMSYATTWTGAGTTQGYINIHVKPNLDLANQYASATNWSALIEAGTIRIVEDYV